MAFGMNVAELFWGITKIIYKYNLETWDSRKESHNLQIIDLEDWQKYKK